MDAILAFIEAVAVPGILLVLYFLPTVVASRRGHQNDTAIFMLNLLGGWTGWGWVAAMVWACTAVQRREA